MICDKHGTRMSVWEHDRGGTDWMCGTCLVEQAKVLGKTMLADELEKLYDEHRAGQHVNDGRMRVPESMVKLAIRQLRAAARPEEGVLIPMDLAERLYGVLAPRSREPQDERS